MPSPAPNILERNYFGMYQKFFKRLADLLLSGLAILVLALPMLIIAIIIKIDSPGPILFKQKRIGIHKTTFMIWKFRSMPTSVPKDLPTDQFNAMDRLSKWQLFIRKSSLDELPQLFNILMNQMSFCGPRPALWNQDDLIAERDRYGANDVKPGLTGWAQIHGRDELEVSEKAKWDGEYAAALSAGKGQGLKMDLKCFFGTFIHVLRADGVVEGGTGALTKEQEEQPIKK